jgi:NhaA family Na+:H+ antiporter
MPINRLQSFFKMEAAGGIVLVLASALAIWIANSPLAGYYQALLDVHATVRIGTVVDIDKPLRLWVDDGLMAIFFFLVGLEIKRELKQGQLSTREQALLPLVAAAGGMVVPAFIYAAINIGSGETLKGWAIPAATDIAFALSVLALLGRRVPLALKVFLTAVAIFDDLGAIIIIAIFYTPYLSFTSLSLAGVALAVLAILNAARVSRLALYIVVGIVLWVCVLKSGVHATLAGVALAMAIPMTGRGPEQKPLLESCEHGLHPWVAFGVLPVFGFANAGISFAGLSWSSFLQPITLGIALGLFFGKQIGVFCTAWFAVRSGLARLPAGATWPMMYGVSLLAGIGFTMSLFIGGLAWEHTDYDAQVRLGVITGSVASAVCGSLLLMWACRHSRPA